MRRLGPLLWAALVAAGCGSDHTLRVHVVAPADAADPFASALTVRLTVAGRTSMSPINGGHFDLTIPVSGASSQPLTQVLVEGLSASGDRVAYGSTPPLQLAAANGAVWVFVAPPGSVSTPQANDGTPYVLSPARTHQAAALVPGYGIFLAGGLGPGHMPLDSVTLWYSYELIEVANPAFRLGLPRSDIGGGVTPDGLLEWIGGSDAGGAPTSLAEIMDPSGNLGLPYVRPVTMAGQAGLARAGAATVLTSEGALLFGGVGTGGAAQAGALLFTPLAATQAVTWTGAVARAATTATANATRTQIIVFGGGPAGQPVLERYTNRMTAQVVTPSPTSNRTGHSATLLDDGRILWIGGNDDSGAALASATVYDPVMNVATEMSGFLHTARAGHTATRVGGQILVAGGASAANTLAPNVEVFDAKTLAFVREAAMAAPRTHHTAMDPGNATVVLLGGEDQAGNPIGRVEIYTP
jgi:hypothetical protein